MHSITISAAEEDSSLVEQMILEEHPTGAGFDGLIIRPDIRPEHEETPKTVSKTEHEETPKTEHEETPKTEHVETPIDRT